MSWGTVEIGPEVKEWMDTLTNTELATVIRQLDRLEDLGVLLPHPFSSQIQGKLRELRFHLQSGQFRITYFITTKRRIVLLTVFRKSKGKESREIKRALQKMKDYNHLDIN